MNGDDVSDRVAKMLPPCPHKGAGTAVCWLLPLAFVLGACGPMGMGGTMGTGGTATAGGGTATAGGGTATAGGGTASGGSEADAGTGGPTCALYDYFTCDAMECLAPPDPKDYFGCGPSA